MKKIRLSILFCSLSAFLSLPLAAQHALLPMPQSVETGKGAFSFKKPFRIIDNAGRRWHNIYTAPIGEAAAERAARVVVFESGTLPPEGYRLAISPDTLRVTAATAEGFLRAGQTLRQLADTPTAAEGVALTAVPCGRIADAPRYAYRGVMLDVSRHFFTIGHLKKQIKTLAAYKVNKLHLHLTDAAGWRMEIKRYPRLTQQAAFRTDSLWKSWWNGGRTYAFEGERGTYGGYYTQDELRELVAYAAARGIEIVPEIEMPAHSEEVLTAYPEFSCTHEPYKQADFCLGNAGTYDFLENVLLEVIDVFPSRFIHVGGDEAGKASWPKCPLCRRKAEELGLKSTDALQGHLITRMQQFLKSRGRELIAWDEVLADKAAPGATLMVWRSTDFARKALAEGYNVVLAPGSHFYLDFYQDAPPSQPEAIGGYTPLEKVYGFNHGFDLSPDEAQRLRGVQCNLWAEYVPTAAHAEYMLYPRAIALAETGWGRYRGNAGTAETATYEHFRRRAATETEKLRAAGINAFDLKHERGERPERNDRPLRHKALGAAVAYNAPYHEAYPAAGNATLTDGLRGGWANNDGRWQGFISRRRLDVTLDFGRTVRFSTVSADFMQQQGPEIYFPETFRISVSADGENFSTLHEQTQPFLTDVLHDVRTYRWRGKAVKARYVRIEAAAGKRGGWVFADEIVVE